MNYSRSVAGDSLPGVPLRRCGSSVGWQKDAPTAVGLRGRGGGNVVPEMSARCARRRVYPQLSYLIHVGERKGASSIRLWQRASLRESVP